MQKGHYIHTTYISSPHKRPDNLTAVLLHGGGQSSTDRFLDLAKFFADEGVSVVLLDFVGHGKTGGEITRNSLTLRTEHALAAISHWVDDSVPLILCGSSMSGHTALRVSAQLGDRVRSLWLMQSAVYAAEAEDVFFGPAFTKILHESDSWHNSLALKDAQQFRGLALVIIGSEDKVIPFTVIEDISAALRNNAESVRLEILKGVGHTIPTWLPQHPEVTRRPIRFLTKDSV